MQPRTSTNGHKRGTNGHNRGGRGFIGFGEGLGGVSRVHDERDFHRAVEAYRFFYPTVSMEGIFNGSREAGVADGKGMMVMATGPRHVGFTLNSDTPYGAATLDLQDMGPVVVEMPSGPFIGLVNDHNQRWVIDMGLPGPDGGKGGKYLLLPPGYAGNVPAGYHIGRSPTYKAMVAVRALPERSKGEGDWKAALQSLRQVKVYPLSDPRAVLPHLDFSNRALDLTPLRWERTLEFWRRLHGIIESEPPSEESRLMYGELAALGIERARPFAPDERMRHVLEAAAHTALEEMRAEGFASERPDRLVWKDRQWEWASLITDDPNFETRDFTDLQARDRWFIQAIVASPAMFRRRAGSGSIYFEAIRDGGGAYLDGGRSYKLTVPHPVPAKLFWSVTAYDIETRSQVQTAQDRAVLTSLRDGLTPDPDGTIQLTFGPEPPDAPSSRQRWLQTTPGRGFFLYFRIYGPDIGAFDGSWRLGDVTSVEAPGKSSAIEDETLRAISTPEAGPTATPGGALSFPLGVPSPETAAAVYDQLDHLHAVDAYLGGLRAVSLTAARRGFLDAGINDNDVLIFSGLMDSRSLFLTANCDTVYFMSFIDLTDGPVVLEAPPRTLSVIDDMWFRWVGDVGLAGPDRGEGGRFLLVSAGYRGPLPEGGFFTYRSATNRVVLLGRAFLEDDDPRPAVARIKQGLKIYAYEPGGFGLGIGSALAGRGPLGTPAEPPSPRFVEGTGLAISTIPPNDVSFFSLLDATVQAEPIEALDPEVAGAFAAIGIVKDQPFRPDARLTKILAEAIAAANAAARTLAFTPRPSEGFHYYGPSSRWLSPLFVGGYEFQQPPPLVTRGGVVPLADPGARHLHGQAAFFYVATGITPAMCMRLPGVGSQYLAAMTDAGGNAFDGARTYTITLPPEIPAEAFWSLTLYDNQTRSMLETPQRFPRAGSQSYPTPAAEPSQDGATTIVIGPERPPELLPPGNWIQTQPGHGWFVILRLYSPAVSFFDQSWRPGEVELVR
jgi:hypothetical protein